MLNNQKENKEFLGKEEMGIDLTKEANVGEASATPKAVQSAQISGLNHVENSTNRESNGQCLEACIAMWVNRFSGTKFTADRVYDDMVAFGEQQSPTIEPKNVPAERMLQEYYHCGPCVRYEALSPNQVLKQLQTGKPVIMYIKNSADKRHAVIVKGIQINGSFITYTVDDPNKKHDPKELTERTITQYVGKSDTASEKISTYTTYYTKTKTETYNIWYATISNTI